MISINCPSHTGASKCIATIASTRTTPFSISLRIRDRDRLAETGASRERALPRRAGGFAVTKKDRTEDDKIILQNEIILPPSIKFLKLLVTLLAGVMIVGFVIIVCVFVINFRKSHALIPATLELPDDIIPIAYTQTRNWYAIVTDDDEILIFDNTGNEIQKIKVNFKTP